MPRGYTLVEITLALALLALTAASLAPAARTYRDRAAAVGARESVAGLFAEARMRAPGSGGAKVRVVGPPWVASLAVGVCVWWLWERGAGIARRVTARGGDADPARG